MADHAGHVARLVVADADLNCVTQILGPCGDFGIDHITDLLSGVDQVETASFDDLQGDRRGAVKPSSAGAVFERQADFSQIAQRNHTVPICLNGKGVNITWFIKAGGDLDGKCAAFCLDLTGCDQQVILGYDIDQFTRCDIICL